MPLVRPPGPGSGDDAAQSKSFRPPWVKQGPPALPMPSAPWALKKRESQSQQGHPQSQNKERIVPFQRQDAVQCEKESTTSSQSQGPKQEKPVLMPAVESKDTKPPKPIFAPAAERKDAKPPKPEGAAFVQNQTVIQEKSVPTPTTERKDTKPPKPEGVTSPNQNQGPKHEKTITPPHSERKDTRPPKSEEPKKKVQISKEPSIVMDTIPQPPAPPPPMPPPPPPPPSLAPKPLIDKKPLSNNQVAKLDALKNRPRKRPDWSDMMKEVEEGVKLKHVVCNDRSAPVMPMAKAKGQFVYDSEKENAHNQLLKEIQGGIRLKKVKCNDRSKPILDGLRKFRRQMTIEEQIVKKSTSMADVVAMAAEPDELDDIDKVRDDLQSTKQMLAHELRNKETLERENKRLLARLMNLEAELEKEKSSRAVNQDKGELHIRTPSDDKLISKLKEEASEASNMIKEMEDKYKKTAEELDVTRAKLESAWLQNAELQQQWQNIRNHPEASQSLPKLPSSKKLANASFHSRPLLSDSEDSDDEITEDESESDPEGEEDPAAQQEKRIARELKLVTAKLRSMKEKKQNAKNEKIALKLQFSNLTKSLNSEIKRYKQLQKEVDKMAKLVKDVDEDVEDDPEEEQVEQSEESESENESDESEGSEESEGELPESASSQEKIQNLTRRAKVCENRVITLKKCNYLLKANIDRRQDEINKQREVILSLQEDLNAVLAELG